MKIPRVTITHLAVVVAVVAVNLAVGRNPLRDKQAFHFAAVAAVAIQFGVYKLVRSRARIFWAGFVAGGALALTTIFWTHYLEPAPEPLSPRWVVWNAWEAYSMGSAAADTRLRKEFPFLPLPKIGLFWEVEVMLIIYFPQLVIALTAGFLARLIFRRGGVCPPQATAAPGD